MSLERMTGSRDCFYQQIKSITTLSPSSVCVRRTVTSGGSVRRPRHVNVSDHALPDTSLNGLSSCRSVMNYLVNLLIKAPLKEKKDKALEY